MNAQIITTVSYKGGSGKTTTAAVLAQAAAHTGHKTLLIDFDAQCNLTFAIGGDPEQAGSYEMILKGRKVTPQQISDNLFIIPARADLAAIQSADGSAHRLQNALTSYNRKFDYIFIDTPPGAGEMQYNALQAATGVIIPLEADIFNLQAFTQLICTIAQFQQSNAGLAVLGVVLTRYDGRSNLTKQMAQVIKNQAQELNIPYLGEIRQGIAIKEAAALQTSLFDYAPNSKPATDYMAVFDRIETA